MIRELGWTDVFWGLLRGEISPRIQNVDLVPIALPVEEGKHAEREASAYIGPVMHFLFGNM